MYIFDHMWIKYSSTKKKIDRTTYTQKKATKVLYKNKTKNNEPEKIFAEVREKKVENYFEWLSQN